MVGLTNLLQCCRHDLGPVVDCKNNVGDASSREGLDLMQDHGLVSELDQRLREGEGLAIVSYCDCGEELATPDARNRLADSCAPARLFQEEEGVEAESSQAVATGFNVQEGGDGYRNHRRE